MQKVFKKSAIAALLALSVGCASSDTKSPSRGIASDSAATAPTPAPGDVEAEETASMEREFQILLKSQAGGVKTHTTKLERLLRIYYRAELYVEEFEKNLDEITAKIAKDPKFTADPLEHPSYRKLIGQRMLIDRTLNEIEFTYGRLLAVTRDGETPAPEKQTAAELLEGMNRWVQSLGEEDKLQLVDLFRHLDEVKANFDTAQNGGRPNRSVAAATDIATYARMETAELERRHKKLKSKTHKKAAATKSWHDAESDGEFAWIQFDKSDRLPSSAKIYPSAGPDGNVIGKVFPSGVFVLTFDDGPGKSSTNRLLGILKQYNAPATFFMLAKQVIALPSVVENQKASFGGHLNNHSWSHANFAKSSQAQLNHEIIDSTNTLKKSFGRGFEFFRCPYGACFAPKIPRVREMIANLGLIHAYWTVDSLDWKNIGQPGRTLDLMQKQMAANGRGIILMHDIHESSVDATKLLLDWNAKNKKYRWQDLETAVAQVNGN